MVGSRVARWAVVVAVGCSGVWMALTSLAGFARASWRESEVGIDKVSTAPLYELVQAGALDVNKAAEVARMHGHPIPPGEAGYRSLTRYLFANDARLLAMADRNRATSDALVAVLCLGSTCWLAWEPIARRGRPAQARSRAD